MKTVEVVAVTCRRLAEHAEAVARTVAALPFPARGHLVERDLWRLADFNRFMVSELPAHVGADFALTVHWDGFGLSKRNWTDEFLEYDWVGAPWPRWISPAHRVGNGGLSLRSRAWMERARELGNPCGRAEDYWQCAENAAHFAGLRVAPLELAARFAVENPMPELGGWRLEDSWGFHDFTFPGAERHRLRPATSYERWRAVARRANNAVRNMVAK